MTLDLLRHGEAVGGRLYRGGQDDALTKKGWAQMRVSTRGKNWDFIATSPLIRCAKFAQYLSTSQNIPYQIFNELKELGFGDWEGKSPDQITQTVIDTFKKDPINNPIANSENLHDFQCRVIAILTQIIQNSKYNKILLVAHAGVIRVIKSHLLGLTIEKMFTINVAHGSCERFDL